MSHLRKLHFPDSICLLFVGRHLKTEDGVDLVVECIPASLLSLKSESVY